MNKFEWVEVEHEDRYGRKYKERVLQEVECEEEESRRTLLDHALQSMMEG